MNLLGVTTDLVFQDIWGLDPDLLAMIPKPVKAVLLLFPITEQYEEHRRDQNKRIASQFVSDELVFIPQTIGNACGTIGLYHSLANNPTVISFGTGVFGTFMEQLKKTPKDQIATLLEKDNSLAQVHEARY
jgi:ubiquitin carboxyl-terminal hydrolase L3